MVAVFDTPEPAGANAAELISILKDLAPGAEKAKIALAMHKLTVGTEAKCLVPVLINMTKDVDGDMRKIAVDKLSGIAPDDQQAVTAIYNCFTAPTTVFMDDSGKHACRHCLAASPADMPAFC